MSSLLLLLSLLLPADPPAWPGFLGVGATPIEPASIPLNWSPTQNVAWDASLPGHGQSSPVIWNDLAFVTTV
ncbi:MAG: pyrrolo-quinoline quinone, partial [Planctomyces sp.]